MSRQPLDRLGGTAHGMPPAAAPQPDPRDHPLPVYDARPPSLGLAGWSIIFGVTLLLVGAVVAVVAAHRDIANISARDARIAAERQCEAPRRDGDLVVLTVRHRGGQLVATCERFNDWRAPERFSQ